MKFLSEWFDRVDRDIIPVSVDAGLAIVSSLLIVMLLQAMVPLA